MNLIPEGHNEPANVVAINEEAARHLEILRKQEPPYDYIGGCIGLHKKIEVDGVTRTVKCLQCGRTIDAFDYLMQWAKEGDRRMTGLKGLDVESRVKTAEVRDLTQKIASLRSTLKRLGGASMDEHYAFKSAEMNPQSETTQKFLAGKDAS